jgi:hypothetical protein
MGFQVQRGEHSIKIPVVVERENEDNETIKRLFKSHVFCRCQVKQIGTKQEDKTETKPIEPSMAITPILPVIEPIKPKPIQPKIEPIKVNHSDNPIDNIMKGWQVV